MPNEILWISFALADLCAALAIYRFFGKSGLFALVAFNLIVCNIQVLKTVTLFGLTTTLGNILYASVFLATDILSEFYGKKTARQAVYLGFVVLVLTTLYMQVALLFTPAPSDFAQGPLSEIFGLMPRIAAASLCAYLASQLHDVWAFHLIREKTGERHLWLRNNLSTFISQLIDSLVFCAIAFVGVFPWPVFFEILLTTYVFKLIVAMLDTPFIYLARRMKPREI